MLDVVNDRRTVVAILIGCAALYIATAAKMMDFGTDTSTYFELARSIRGHHGYVFDFELHTFYPPGYPTLLAGLMSIGGESFRTLVRLSVPIYFLGLLALYRYLRLTRDPKTSLVIIVLVVTSFAFYLYSTLGLYSDAPYLTVSMTALLVFEIARRTERQPVRVWAAIGFALLASYLLLLRSIGVTMAGGLALWIAAPALHLGAPPAAVRQRARVWLPVLVVPLMVFGIWMTWSGRHKTAEARADFTQSYIQQILKEDPHQIGSPNVTVRTLPGRTFRVLTDRIENSARLVFNAPSLTVSWSNPVAALFFLAVLTGFIQSLTREGALRDFYALSYGALLVLYPYSEGIRYLFPIQPLLILYGIDGLEAVEHRLASETSPRWLRRFAALCAVAAASVAIATLIRRPLSKSGVFSAGLWAMLCILAWVLSGWVVQPEGSADDRLIGGLRNLKVALFTILVAAGVYQVFHQAERQLRADPNSFTNALTFRVSNWVNASTAPDDVIMNDEPAILHRLTGRRTIRVPLETDPTVIAARIAADRVKYVVVMNEVQYEYYLPSTMARFEELKRRYPGKFVPVHDFGEGKVYQVSEGSDR